MCVRYYINADKTSADTCGHDRQQPLELQTSDLALVIHSHKDQRLCLSHQPKCWFLAFSFAAIAREMIAEGHACMISIALVAALTHTSSASSYSRCMGPLASACRAYQNTALLTIDRGC